MSRGFSLIEILIAMAIAIMVISGVTMSSGGFGLSLRGYQSSLSSAELQAEAATKANQLIQKISRDGYRDTALLQPQATTTQDMQYYEKIRVELLPDFLTNLVTARIEWKDLRGATSSTEFSTLVPNLENVRAPDTCGPVVGDWTRPNRSAVFPIDNGNSTATGNAVTDLDAFYRKLYIATENTNGTSEDLYVYDVSNPRNPTYLSSIKTITRRAGLSAIVVATTTVGTYVFAASAYDPNWNTCTVGPNCSQLQVISVTNPTSPAVVSNYKLGTSSLPYVLGNISGGSGQATGKSVFYKNGFLYLGLSKTANGPGFHVLDVGNGAYGGTATSPVWVTSWPTASPTFGTSGAAINGIYIKGNYAYLLHPTGLIGTSGALNEQITVLDVSNLANITRVGGFFSNGGIGGHGKTLTQVGNSLYFARTQSLYTTPEFYILDGTDPVQLSLRNPAPYGRAFGETINALLVHGPFAFAATNSSIQLFNVSVPSQVGSVPQIFTWNLAQESGLGAGSTGNALDCEGDTVYAGSYLANSDKGALLLFSPS